MLAEISGSASETRYSLAGRASLSVLTSSCRASLQLKDVHKLSVTAGNLGHRGRPRFLLGSQSHQWFPEARPAHGETDISRNGGGGRQPLTHLLIILTAAQHDATDLVPTSAARS